MDTGSKENTDLLAANRKSIPNTESNGNAIHEDSAPPDGGFRAYSVVIGSFLTNGLIFGVINSYSVIYPILLKRLQAEDVNQAEVRASLVGVLTIGTTFMLSPLSGFLTALMGLRMTAVLGGSIGALGLLLSSFAVSNVNALCFTYGVMYGLGASLAYTPSLAILGHYFQKYLGIVNGIVAIGSSVFTVIMPPLMKYMIDNYGLEWMFRLISITTFGIAFCGLLFKPISVVVIEKSQKDESRLKSLLKNIGSAQVWKIKKYRLWALSMPVALFGYFVPYVHIQKFIEKANFDISNANLPLQCIGFSSALGRLIFGFLGDKKGIDKILLQQISFYVIGVLTIILPFVKSFGLLVAITLGMGLFEGGFIALIGPIAIQLCGSAYAAQAIGCMLGLASVPLSVGPPVAGALCSLYNSYTLPFVLAGISPLVGATLMFAIRFLDRNKEQKPDTNSNGHISLTARPDLETAPTPLLASKEQINHQSRS